MKPYKLIGRRNGFDGELIKFSFGGYDEMVLVNSDRCNVFLFIDINPIFAIY